jgi:2-methylcitrate dehydratase PrpD
MNQALSQHFAEWSSATRFSDIPAEVKTAARRAIVDAIGVMTAGARHEVTIKVANAFVDRAGACSLVVGGSASPSSAALINGTAVHAWDFDDTSYTGIMHGTAVILPAVLSAAEATGASDEATLAGFVVGSEVAYTLADITNRKHYFRGWWSTVTLGLIGATVGAAYVFGLDKEKTACAIGMAAASSGGGKAVFGTDAKPFLVGAAARAGLDYACAAKTGVTGPIRGFEDSRGFFSLLNNGESSLDEAKMLGERWRLVDPGLFLKQYPVCSGAQAVIEQVAALCKEANVTPQLIDTIECHVPELVNISLVFDDPRSVQEAQFSLPYAAACAARHRTVRLQDLSPSALLDPEVRSLMRLIRKFSDPKLSNDEMSSRYPESARVILRLKDGRQFDGFCGAASGMPSRPMSESDLSKKFDSCVAFSGGAPTDGDSVLGRLRILGESKGIALGQELSQLWTTASENRRSMRYERSKCPGRGD